MVLFDVSEMNSEIQGTDFRQYNDEQFLQFCKEQRNESMTRCNDEYSFNEVNNFPSQNVNIMLGHIVSQTCLLPRHYSGGILTIPDLDVDYSADQFRAVWDDSEDIDLTSELSEYSSAHSESGSHSDYEPEPSSVKMNARTIQGFGEHKAAAVGSQHVPASIHDKSTGMNVPVKDKFPSNPLDTEHQRTFKQNNGTHSEMLVDHRTKIQPPPRPPILDQYSPNEFYNKQCVFKDDQMYGQTKRVHERKWFDDLAQYNNCYGTCYNEQLPPFSDYIWEPERGLVQDTSQFDRSLELPAEGMPQSDDGFYVTGVNDLRYNVDLQASSPNHGSIFDANSETSLDDGAQHVEAHNGGQSLISDGDLKDSAAGCRPPYQHFVRRSKQVDRRFDEKGHGTVGVRCPSADFIREPLSIEMKRQLKKMKRGCRLWEFIRNLLLDPTTNPSLIRWENRAEGTFKLVQSKAIAYKWGMKKGNEEMTYEKLSRAMRYYYKRQVFQPVLGKRLVYRFGPRATGWKGDS